MTINLAVTVRVMAWTTFLVAAMFAMAGCSGMMNTPTAQSVAGLSPAGNVTITEDFVTGVGGGSGTLEYQGRTYPFKSSALLRVPVAGLRKSRFRPRLQARERLRFSGQIHAKHRQSRSQLIRQQRSVVGEQRRRDHAFPRYEYWRDADLGKGRDLHSDGSVSRPSTG